MGKIRNVYRCFTDTQLKNRSEIPTAANIALGTTYIDCTNISLAGVKSVLSGTTYSLYDLCRHANVNHWSAFGPTVRTVTGSGYDKVLVNSDPTVCKLGDFAGYNHGAVTPGWQSGGEAAAEANNWVNAGTKATCTANIDLGEVDWNGDLAVLGIAMLLFDSGDAIVGWGKKIYSDVTDTGLVTMSAETDSTMSTDHTDWYARIFLTDTYVGLADSSDVYSAVVCEVPNVTAFEINIKVKQQSTLYLDATLWDFLTDPKTVGNVIFSGISFNVAPGTITFSDLKDSSVGIDGICIHVQVLDWLDNVVSEGNIYDNTDHAMTPDVPPYGAYTSGFWLVFDLSETIRTFDAGALDYTYGYRFLVTVPEHA